MIARDATHDNSNEKEHVVSFTGDSFIEENIHMMNLFEIRNTISKLICEGLVLTSGVINAGFDSNNIKCLLRIDMPTSLAHAFQEIGRVGRNLNTLLSEMLWML